MLPSPADDLGDVRAQAMKRLFRCGLVPQGIQIHLRVHALALLDLLHREALGLELLHDPRRGPNAQAFQGVQAATVEHDPLTVQRAGLCFPAVVVIDFKRHQRDFLRQIHNVFPPKCGILGGGRVPPDPCVTRSAHVVPS
ncbi:Uncharacterised protein [uncultured Clostridium sp.]|nr:Uncharacterised protein [uncultured Clostridium sp.]